MNRFVQLLDESYSDEMRPWDSLQQIILSLDPVEFYLRHSAQPHIAQAHISSNTPLKIPTVHLHHSMMVGFRMFSFLFICSCSPTSALYGEVSTLAGSLATAGSTNGIGTFAKFRDPAGLTISFDESFALIADWHNQVIRKIILSIGTVTLFAGSSSASMGSNNGAGTNARLRNPLAISLYFDDSYALVADTSNNLIRKIITTTADVTTLAGSTSGSTNGVGTLAKFNNPYGVCISPNGVFALVLDVVGLIRHIDLATTSVTIIAGGSSGGTNGFGTNAGFSSPQSASISPDSSYALIADVNSYRIRKMIIATAEVTTLAGGNVKGTANGIGTLALFQSLRGLSISPDGSYALVTDLHSIRIISIATKEVNVFVGSSTSGSANGFGTNAEFNKTQAVDISSSGDFALVIDLTNQLIRRLDLFESMPTSIPSGVPTSIPSDVPTSIPSGVPTSIPSGVPTSIPSGVPTSIPSDVPTSTPSGEPTTSPSVAIVRYGFGVLFGHQDILSSSKCLIVDYVRDAKGKELLVILFLPSL
jgi:hypothetical protein